MNSVRYVTNIVPCLRFWDNSESIRLVSFLLRQGKFLCSIWLHFCKIKILVKSICQSLDSPSLQRIAVNIYIPVQTYFLNLFFFFGMFFMWFIDIHFTLSMLGSKQITAFQPKFSDNSILDCTKIYSFSLVIWVEFYLLYISMIMKFSSILIRTP